MNRLICIALIVVCCAVLGAALQCYECTGNFVSKGNCFDPFTSSGQSVITCPADQICYKQKSGLGDAMVIKRGCQSSNRATGCDPASPGDGAATCYCNTDKCNGAGKTAATGSVLLGLAALLIRFI